MSLRGAFFATKQSFKRLLRFARNDTSFFMFILVLSFFTGCMQMQMLPYLNQALVLKDFGAEKDAQHSYIKNADAKFDRMLAEFQSGEIQKYETEKDIIKAFGPPVLTKTVDIDGKIMKQDLYRYAIAHKGPNKIYVYYDQQGQLEKWELRSASF